MITDIQRDQTQPKPRLHAETLGLLLGFLGVLAFSFSLPMTRLAVKGLNPVFIALGRAVAAAVLAAPALWLMRATRPTRTQVRRLCVVAFGVVVGFPLFSSIALRYVPAARGSIVNGLLPLATAVIGALLNRERPSKVFWLAACVGSLAVIAYAIITGGGAPHPADLLMLLAVLTGALGYVEGARLSRELGGPQTICWALVIAAPVLLPFAIAFAPSNPAAVPASAWAGFAYVSVFSMFLGFFAWYKGLALGGIARVSQVQLLQTFLSLINAALLLGESISPWMWVTSLIVIASIFVSRRAVIKKV